MRGACSGRSCAVHSNFSLPQLCVCSLCCSFARTGQKCTLPRHACRFFCVNIMFWWFEGVAAAPLLRAILCARVHPLHGFPPVSVAGVTGLVLPHHAERASLLLLRVLDRVVWGPWSSFCTMLSAHHWWDGYWPGTDLPQRVCVVLLWDACIDLIVGWS
jgi:hypothetical protein